MSPWPGAPHRAVHGVAIRFERLIQAGAVADYAELARLGHVTRARITQIMNLRLLSPDIQERLLFLLPHAADATQVPCATSINSRRTRLAEAEAAD